MDTTMLKISFFGERQSDLARGGFDFGERLTVKKNNRAINRSQSRLIGYR
jgi:hypothetical protein